MPDTDFVWFGFLNPLGGGSTSILQGRKTVNLVETAPDNCQFTGYIDDIRGAYAAGDIFYFPTRNENQGIALLEAMACGKPVVTRDIPTYEGWLAHDEHCLKAGNVAGFKQALRRLIEDDGLRERIGANAADLAGEHSLEAVGDRLVAAYDRVLADSR